MLDIGYRKENYYESLREWKEHLILYQLSFSLSLFRSLYFTSSSILWFIAGFVWFPGSPLPFALQQRRDPGYVPSHVSVDYKGNTMKGKKEMKVIYIGCKR